MHANVHSLIFTVYLLTVFVVSPMAFVYITTTMTMTMTISLYSIEKCMKDCTFSPRCKRVLMMPTWPYLAAVWIDLAPRLFGMCRYTPFLKSIVAHSEWPFSEAMCIRVEPSLVLSKMLALNLSANSSITDAWPFSAARCIGVRSWRSVMAADARTP